MVLSSTFFLLFLFTIGGSILQVAAAISSSNSCPTRVKNVDYSVALDIYDPHVVRDWNELSGLAVSPYQKGPSGSPVVWGHNDGRDQAKNGTNFAAWDSGTGERLLTFHLMYSDTSNPPIYNQDWEDMTIGTCSGDDSDEICLYFADTGDNGASGANNINKTSRPANRPYVIYKVKEPVLEDFYPNIVAQLDTQTYVTALTIDYLDETSPYTTRDVEAVFLDHTGWGQDGEKGDLYLASLFRKNGRLYKIPASVWPSQDEGLAHYSPKVVGTNYRDGLEFTSWVWRSGDMSWDGTKIILGNTKQNFVFLRCPGQSVADALVGPDACMRFANPPEGADVNNQYEGVAWVNDSGGYTVFNVAEIRTGTMKPRLVKSTFGYGNPELNGYCPPAQGPTKSPTPKPTNKPRDPTATPTAKPSMATTKPTVMVSIATVTPTTTPSTGTKPFTEPSSPFSEPSKVSIGFSTLGPTSSDASNQLKNTVNSQAIPKQGQSDTTTDGSISSGSFIFYLLALCILGVVLLGLFSSLS